MHAQNQFQRRALPQGGEFSSFHNRHARGPVRARKIRKVCGPHCNGGWMSRIEDRAAGVLTPLIQGQGVLLGRDDLRLIANWAVLTSIIGEYSDPNSAAIPPADRDALMLAWTQAGGIDADVMQTLTSGWIVEVGAREAAVNWNPTYAHVAATWVPRGEPVAGAKLNTQTTTLSVGHFVVRAASSKYELVLPRDRHAAGLVQIWPNTPDGLQWPAGPILSAESTEWIGNILRRSPVGMP